MIRVYGEQLELDFEDERKQIEQALPSPGAQVSASIICFTSHLRSRLALEEEARNAKLLEQITSRVRRFK